MQPLISTHTWVSLDTEQRARIRALFSIPRSSHVVVNDGRVETDGTTVEDLKHLTVDKMKEYLKEESTDFHYLFDKVLSRVQDEIEGKAFIEVVEEPIKSAKPIKNAKTKKSK